MSATSAPCSSNSLSSALLASAKGLSRLIRDYDSLHALARRADDRELLQADADVADIGLTEAEKVELLGQ